MCRECVQHIPEDASGSHGPRGVKDGRRRSNGGPWPFHSWDLGGILPPPRRSLAAAPAGSVLRRQVQPGEDKPRSGATSSACPASLVAISSVLQAHAASRDAGLIACTLGRVGCLRADVGENLVGSQPVGGDRIHLHAARGTLLQSLQEIVLQRELASRIEGARSQVACRIRHLCSRCQPSAHALNTVDENEVRSFVDVLIKEPSRHFPAGTQA